MTVKYISKFAIKSITTNNEPCKTIGWVCDNGVVHINILVLSTNKKLRGYKKLFTKLGKNLFVKDVGFKYPTLNTINKLVTQSLVEHKIKPEDILK
jgi:hypothetical protein